MIVLAAERGPATSLGTLGGTAHFRRSLALGEQHSGFPQLADDLYSGEVFPGILTCLRCPILTHKLDQF